MPQPLGDRQARRNPGKTRAALMLAAYNEIHRYGYQGMRVDAVLNAAGVHKGAFYHHFASKRELAFAVIDEIIAQRISDNWTAALYGAVDPIEAIIGTLTIAASNLDSNDLELGCPLCNLAQEMSPLDDEFRARLEQLFDGWVGDVEAALLRGQASGYVGTEVDCRRSAVFLVSALHGCIARAKAAQDLVQLQNCAQELIAWLERLRVI